MKRVLEDVPEEQAEHSSAWSCLMPLGVVIVAALAIYWLSPQVRNVVDSTTGAFVQSVRNEFSIGTGTKERNEYDLDEFPSEEPEGEPTQRTCLPGCTANGKFDIAQALR